MTTTLIIETTTSGPLKTTTLTADRIIGQDENGDSIRETFPVHLSADGESFVLGAGEETEIGLNYEELEAFLAAKKD